MNTHLKEKRERKESVSDRENDNFMCDNELNTRFGGFTKKWKGFFSEYGMVG